MADNKTPVIDLREQTTIATHKYRCPLQSLVLDVITKRLSQLPTKLFHPISL